MSDRATILVHYYRALVGRADIWRMRMDATTNWAIGTTAAVLSFALGNAASPHYVVHVGFFLTLVFLLLEARRLTFYHLWQRRALVLERGLVAPALRAAPEEGTLPLDPSLEGELAGELGTTIPSMSITKAAARRLRRVYVYLLGVQLAAWGLKLASHPEATTEASEILARAHIGPLPGVVVVTGTAFVLLGAAALALFRGGVRS